MGHQQKRMNAIQGVATTGNMVHACNDMRNGSGMQAQCISEGPATVVQVRVTSRVAEIQSWNPHVVKNCVHALQQHCIREGDGNGGAHVCHFKAR